MKLVGFLSVGCAAVLLLFATSAGALKTARMALPEDFGQNADVLQAAGFGGRNKGSYAIGKYSGAFTRGESRLGVFDPLYVASRGKSSFTFTGADGTEIKAACQVRKNTVTIGIVTLDPKKMSYQCDFSRADSLSEMRFVLGHPKPDNLKARVLAKDFRRGADASIQVCWSSAAISCGP